MNRSVRKRKEKLKLDQMMRVLFKLSRKVTVALVNGLFDERFAEEEVMAIRYGNADFIRDDYDRIIGDLFLTLETKRGTFHYHVEFQTLNDQSMVIRMFRYGFEKAVELAAGTGTADPGAVIASASTSDIDLETTASPDPADLTSRAGAARQEAAAAAEPTVVAFPQQRVIFLEENEGIGDELSFLLRLPDGTEVPYVVPVMKYWTYTAEQLRARRMYALLPLQVFGSRKRMRAIEESRRPEAEKMNLMAEEFGRLKETIRQTMDILGELHDRKEIGMGDLERILRVCDSITEYLYGRYGGYESTGEEMRRMIKTFIDPRVRKEGKREGLEEGKREGKIEVARSLLALGVDMDKIVRATGLSAEEVMRAAESNDR